MSKKILIVTDNTLDQINGVVTTYKNIAAQAQHDGYEVVYLTPSDFSHFGCPGYPEIKLTLPVNIGKIIDDISPDHIHIATEGPLGIFAKRYLDKQKRRYNTAYHTRIPEAAQQLLGIPQQAIWPLVRWFHKHSGKVLTTTNTVAQELKLQGFTGDIVPWTRGIDRSVFYPGPVPENSEPVLLCVSRVSKEKNLEDFLQLKIENTRKILVGDGPMRSHYEKQYSDVEFVGFKTGSDLANYYRMADVFVFPSLWETFGLVMIESLASGTPVAAYRSPGPSDVIEHGITGYLVDSSDQLAQAVKDCLELDRNQVHHKSQHWSWEAAWQIFKNNLVQ
jgi:glycosyltransferase involved in cell wall biosynthesis